MVDEIEREYPQQHAVYSRQLGSVYLFNVTVASGLIILPKAFVEVGYILGLVALCLLAFMSYITVTLIIEVQSIHNALLRHRSKTKKGSNGGPDCKEELGLHDIVMQNNHMVEHHNEAGVNKKTEEEIQQYTVDRHNAATKNHTDNISRVENTIGKTGERESVSKLEVDVNTDEYLYEITIKAEIGELCEVFFHKSGVIFWYITICLFIYGAQAVYYAAIAKSLTSVICGNCLGVNDTIPCKNITSLSVIYTYRIMLAIFVVLCGPFYFFTVQHTRILQIFTIVFRWFALTSMVILAVIKIEKGEGNNTPNLVVVQKLPNFIGITTFSFMNQFAIPNLITPITNKKHLKEDIILVYVCGFIAYTSLVMTAAYAFQGNEVQDLYTLNFPHPVLFKYSLELFPVFTLSTNLPILGVILGDNLKALCLPRSEEEYGVFVRRILFPLLAIVPSTIISYSTYNIGMLTKYTGTYAGAIIQYIIPAVLLHLARKKAIHVFGDYENKYRSPFQHRIWIILVFIWYLICFVLVTYYTATS